MDITVTSDWTFDSDYNRGFARTSDPRVLAVIEREGEYGGGYIDGDVYAPAFYWDRRNGGIESAAGSTFMDDESLHIAERVVEARDRFMYARMPWATFERFARVFHGTTMAQVTSTIDRDTQVFILNTPTWREHIGWTDEYAAQQDEDIRLTPAMLEGEVKEWQDALDGEVFGIGWATLEERRLEDDEEIDLDAWDIEIQVWGYIGEDYAQESAARFDAGTPDLPEMLSV